MQEYRKAVARADSPEERQSLEAAPSRNSGHEADFFIYQRNAGLDAAQCAASTTQSAL
jgi:hypothetical protein